MINPATGLEDPNYKPTDAFNTPQVTTGGGPKLNLDKINEYRSALGTGAQLERTPTAQTPISTVSNVSGGLSNLQVKPNLSAQITPIESNVTSPGSMTGTTPVVIGGANITPITTNINEQKALTQNELDRQKAVKDTQQSYILNKAQYDTNKGYYSNFDTVNTQFDNVMKERSAILTSSPDGQISDEQAQMIASKYGTTIDAVKNPNKIFEALTATEEGKQKLGITGHEQQMSDAELANTRAKEDAATNLAISTQNIENNIADVQKQLTRNLEFAIASGAWSGGLKSSGYLAGIENIRSDGQTTINRLQTMLANVKSADAKNVGRLTQDYNTAVTRTKTDFDSQLKDLQHNTGLNLNEETSKYGIGTQEFSKQLDKINAQYFMYSADISAKYIANMRAVNDLTTQNIENTQKMQTLQDSITNKRYNEYIDPKNPLAANTTLSAIANDVNTGRLSFEQGNVLKNSMLTSITSALSKVGTVSTDDTNTINAMLQSGKTPSQIVAQMQALEKFKPKATIEKTLDLGDRIRVSYSDGTTEDISKGSESMIEYQRAQMSKESVMTPYQQAQIDIENRKLGSIGAPAFNGASVSPGVTQNRPDRNKNPGNVKIGDVGYGVDDQNHTIFGSEVDGYNAMVKDLTAKLTGGSSRVSKLTGKKLGPDSTLADLGSVYAEDPKWASNLASRSGYPVGTKLKDIDINKLAPALAKIEGFTGTISAQQSPTVSPDAQNYFNLIQKGTTSYEDVFKKLGGSKVGQDLMNDINGLIASKGGAIPALPNSPQVKQMDEAIQKIQGLVNDPDAIENLSGFFQTSPWDALTGKNADTLADIKYILEGKVLQNLIDAKAQGATFGALSNDELNLLKNSSSVLSAMTRKDDKGNVIGFTGSEEKVKGEIKKLLDLFKDKKERMLNPGIDTVIEPTQSEVKASNGKTYSLPTK